MTDRLSLLEDKVERLSSIIESLQARLGALERAGVALPAAQPSEASALDDRSAPVERGPAVERPDLVGVLSLLGRLFIVLGGAFLLRAMTDNGTLPPAAGVGAGLLYAMAWTVAAGRAASARGGWVATFHGLATAIIGFPLIWEATTRFGVLTPAMGAMALTVFVAAMLTVACWRRQHILAWVAAISSMVASIVMIASTSVVVPFALHLIGLGIVTLWIGYQLNWLALRWPVAIVANLVVVGLTTRALAPQPQEPAGVTVAIQLLLVGLYLASIGVRTLVRDRNVIPFEVFQAMASLVVGVGGAVLVLRATGTGAVVLGYSTIVFGVACYAVAFAFIDRRQKRARNVYFYTSLALIFLVTGCVLVMSQADTVVTWLVLAIGAALAWSRAFRLFMLLHAAAYLLAADLAAGVLGYSTAALAGRAPQPWLLPSTGMIAALLTAAAVAWLATTGEAGEPARYARAPRFLILLLGAWVAGGTVVGYLAPLIGGLPAAGVDPGVLATLRTAVLAVSTLILAWAGRRDRFAECGWLVYPLLIGIGLKMISEDFTRSRPATLFVALAVYGAALILAPRLKRPKPAHTSV